jgi:hypothetical protein
MIDFEAVDTEEQNIGNSATPTTPVVILPAEDNNEDLGDLSGHRTSDKIPATPYVRRVTRLADGEVITLSRGMLERAQTCPDYARTQPPLISMQRGFLALEDWGPIVDQVSAESTFDRLEQPTDLPGNDELEAHGEAVGRGEMRCPICHSDGSGRGSVALMHRGKDTGIMIRLWCNSCPCRMFRTIWRELGNEAKVPRLFQGITLEGLVPSTLSLLPAQRQQAIIDALQAKPDDSYYLYGPPQTGKTHMMTAMYRRAVETWAEQESRQRDFQPAVWRVRTTTLLDEHIAWSTRGSRDEGRPTPGPTVTVEKIQAAVAKGYRPRIFLDELDKVVASDYKLGELIKIVDAVYEATGSVVATGNMSVDALSAKWGSNEAGTIMRRIAAGPGSHLVKFA